MRMRLGEAGLVIGLPLLFSFLLFSDAFRAGRDLEPLNQLASIPPWKDALPDPGQLNPLLDDCITQFLPWDRFARQSSEQGLLPLWNPYSACGEPFLANSISAVFFPLSLISSWLPHPYAAKALLKLCACFCFMYLFLVRIGVSRPSGLLGSLCFTFCGFNMLWINHPHSNVSALLPATFYFWSGCRLRNNVGSYVGFLLAATLQFLGGHPETTFHCAIFLFVFSLLFHPTDRRRLPSTLVYTLIVLPLLYVASLGLAGIQIFPFLEYLAYSTTVSVRLTIPGAALSDFYHQIGDWEGGMSLMSPKLFGSPLTGNWVGPVNFTEVSSGFTGMGSLFLAACSLLVRGRVLRRPFVALAVVCLLLIYENPATKVFQHHYPFSLVDHKRMLLGVGFSVSCLAAMGLDSLLEPAMPGKNYLQRLAIFLSLMAALFAAHSIFSKRELQSLDYAAVLVEQGIPFFVTFLLALPLAYRRKTILAFAVLLGSGIELFLFSRNYTPSSAHGPLAAHFPQIDAVKADRDLFRVASMDPEFLFPNTHLFLEVQDVRSYDAVGMKNYFDFLQRVNPFPVHPVIPLAYFVPQNPAMLEFLNVKYVFLPPRKKMIGDNFEKIYPTREAAGSESESIYLNRLALPRAFLARNRVGVVEEREALRIVSSPDFDYRTSVVLEAGRDYQLSAPANGDEGECKVERYGNQEIAIRVRISAPRVLVLSDTYNPGWKAWVDGKPAAVLAANAAFRGILLDEAGEHTVLLRYEPMSFKLGLACTLWGCFLIGLSVGLRLLTRPNRPVQAS